MTEATQRRTGRPPKTSREQILDAAALFDPLELQLTTLAEQLGISVKTVYYYFANRKELLDALTERSVQHLGEPDLRDCREDLDVLRAVARWTFALGRQHPGWYFDTAAPRGVGLRVIGSYLERMKALGVDDDTGLRAFVVVTNFAFTAGQNAARTIRMGGLTHGSVHRNLDEYVDDGTAERLTAFMADQDIDALFEDGLRVVLSGVESELLRRRPSGL